MTTSTTRPDRPERPVRSWPMLFIGAFFAVLTAWTLLGDVIAGREAMTPAHMLSIGAIVAAIASGHAAWPQLRKGAIVPASMLAVLFVAAQTYVLVASAGRNAEVSAAKVARAEAAVAELRALKKSLAYNEAKLRHLRDRLNDACRQGTARCAGAKESIAHYDGIVARERRDLRTLSAEPAPTTGIAHVARTLAALPGVTVAAPVIEERVALILPFLAVLIAELGTIVFLNLGLGGSYRRPEGVASVARMPETVAPDPLPRASVGAAPPATPDAGRPRKPFSRQDAESDLVTLFALGKTIESQEWLADRWGIHEGTVSKWMRSWQARGLVRRSSAGRRKCVTSG